MATGRQAIALTPMEIRLNVIMLADELDYEALQLGAGGHHWARRPAPAPRVASSASTRKVSWSMWRSRLPMARRRSVRRVAGTPGLDVLVIDLDAHVLVCHSEKDTSGRNPSSPTDAYLGRKTGRGFCDYS